MTVILNGEKKELAASVNLAQVVDDLALSSQAIAVELNGRVVRRAEWPQTVIGENDRIEIVHFVGGG